MGERSNSDFTHLLARHVPQADRLARVFELAILVANGDKKRISQIHPRDRRYYSNAAVLLNLLSKDGLATDVAVELAMMSKATWPNVAAKLFSESIVGLAWKSFASEKNLADVNPLTADAFLQSRSDLAQSTALRRAKTIRSWWAYCFSDDQNDQPSAESTTVSVPPPSIEGANEVPPKAQEVFSNMISTATPLDAPSLIAQVQSHLREFESAARENELLPLDLAELLARSLVELLRAIESFERPNQKLIVAAATYFVSDEDATPDLESVLGLDDDVLVHNWVVKTIGLEAKEIEL